ncbi:MAG TPA: CHRD domain-containing protein [Thiobacillus sp.]|nr:CHRD domain-containing protein [Thiobacillus sp.]
MNDPSNSTTCPLSRVAPLALLLMASANLYAQQPISVSLTGDAEVPPVAASAKGTGLIAVMPDRTASGSVKVPGLVPTMAHIHEGAVGKNGPSIFTLTQAAHDSFAVPTGPG